MKLSLRAARSSCLVVGVALAGALGASACAAHAPGEATGFDGAKVEYQDAVGDWSQFPDYAQCLAGVQGFYPAKFGVGVPVARGAWTGDCAPEGACHVWLDDVPDSGAWERIASDGSETPSTYDLIVFPPHAGNPYGHIASVDHVDSAGTIYVMDDNWNGDERKAYAPHSVRAPYGWYHLRALPKSGGGGANECPNDGRYCGGDAIAGDASTLYQCTGHRLSVIESCANGCQVNADGIDDACNAAPAPMWCPNDGLYCGGDAIGGDASTLYRCSAHQTSVEQACGNGCQVNPDGVDDACR